MEPLVIGLFLAIANQKIVEYLTRPLKERNPDGDYWWLLYVALATGAIIGWLSGVNLFAAYIPDVVTGRVLTAVVIGGGSSLIHDLFGN